MGMSLKKIVFLAAMLLAFSGSAAHQFPGGNFNYQVKNDASLKLSFSNGSNGNGNSLGWLARYDKLGYYAIQPDGTYRYETFNIDKFGDGSFDLGEFAAGENVGFFLVDGKKVYTDSFIGKPGDEGGFVIHDQGNATIDFVVNTIGGGASGGGSVPSGQPLPGVLMIFAVGGGLTGGLLMRKRGRGETPDAC